MTSLFLSLSLFIESLVCFESTVLVMVVVYAFNRNTLILIYYYYYCYDGILVHSAAAFN